MLVGEVDQIERILPVVEELQLGTMVAKLDVPDQLPTVGDDGEGIGRAGRPLRRRVLALGEHRTVGPAERPRILGRGNQR